LDGADVAALFEQMSGAGMAEGVAGRALGDASGPYGFLRGALEDRFVQVVAPVPASFRVDVGARGREDPLPGPGASGRGVLPGESVRQFDPTGATGPFAQARRRFFPDVGAAGKVAEGGERGRPEPSGSFRWAGLAVWGDRLLEDGGA